MVEVEKIVAEFCAECLETKLIQDLFNDVRICTECESSVYFRAHVPPEISEEIQNLHDRLGLEYGPVLLVYAATGLVRLEYVDCEPERISKKEVFERIVEGIKGEEGYAYDVREFLCVINSIEQKKLIDKKRLPKLLKVTSKLKREILTEVL